MQKIIVVRNCMNILLMASTWLLFSCAKNDDEPVSWQPVIQQEKLVLRLPMFIQSFLKEVTFTS